MTGLSHLHLTQKPGNFTLVKSHGLQNRLRQDAQWAHRGREEDGMEGKEVGASACMVLPIVWNLALIVFWDLTGISTSPYTPQWTWDDGLALVIPASGGKDVRLALL